MEREIPHLGTKGPVRRSTLAFAALVLAVAPLTAARGSEPTPTDPAGDDCTAEAWFTRTPMSPVEASLPPPALGRPVLRFVQLSDSHILDDEASAVMTGNATDPLLQLGGNTSAQRLQEEFTDEVLDAMEARINACQGVVPSSFMIATGDLTDNMTLNELRRYIDNLDGEYAAPTAFEHFCGYTGGTGLRGRPDPDAAPAACSPEDTEANAVLAGRTVPDSQAPTPNPDEDPTYVPEATRTPRQLAESTALSLRDGTYTAAPGLPAAMKDRQHRLAIPHYAVFGNHDGAVRGTVAYQDQFQTGARAFGRYFTGNQREFINEFFFTSSEPRGHGFHLAGARLHDDDDRNDGWYSFVRHGVRIVVLNTIMDGVREEGGFRDPSALEKGGVSDAQLRWLEDELSRADVARQPALVFSHHPTRSFHDDENGRHLDAVLASHGSVLAHIAGHTHENRVRAFEGGRRFWQIETASLIDWPQEGRIVEVHRLADGRHALRLTMIAPVRDGDAAIASHRLSQAEAECITGRFETSPEPSDGGEASVRSLYCRADRTLSEGGPHERDVILLPG